MPGSIPGSAKVLQIRYKSVVLSHPHADTAILLFAHEAAQEVKEKTFLEEHATGVNVKVAEAMLEHTLWVAGRSGLPLLPVYTSRQVGHTFGERLANAFQEAFLAGYQRVICIGSDCPALETKDLLAAAEALQTNGMVVGPATDGGAYLIGLHIDSYNPESFAILNWQSEELLNELMLYSFRQQHCLGCVALLEEKADVDTSADLQEQLNALPELHRLKCRVLAILLGHTAEILSIGPAFRKPVEEEAGLLPLRAPPLN